MCYKNNSNKLRMINPYLRINCNWPKKTTINSSINSNNSIIPITPTLKIYKTSTNSNSLPSTKPTTSPKSNSKSTNATTFYSPTNYNTLNNKIYPSPKLPTNTASNSSTPTHYKTSMTHYLRNMIAFLIPSINSKPTMTLSSTN